jgi:hypothetical protein
MFSNTARCFSRSCASSRTSRQETTPFRLEILHLNQNTELTSLVHWIIHFGCHRAHIYFGRIRSIPNCVNKIRLQCWPSGMNRIELAVQLHTIRRIFNKTSVIEPIITRQCGMSWDSLLPVPSWALNRRWVCRIAIKCAGDREKSGHFRSRKTRLESNELMMHQGIFVRSFQQQWADRYCPIPGSSLSCGVLLTAPSLPAFIRIRDSGNKQSPVLTIKVWHINWPKNDHNDKKVDQVRKKVDQVTIW